MIIRLGVGLVLLAAIALAAIWLLMPQWNDRQTSGTLALEGLTGDVRIVRDALGTPYIYADNLEDASRAQGFVAGQDRLFQLEAAKRAATGRLAEVFGAGADDAILKLDQEARTIGFHRLGAAQAEMLSPTSRNLLTPYLEGLNFYITNRQDTHPMEFGLAGFEPEVWTEADLLALAYFGGWGSAANFEGELIAHEIIAAIGAEKFAEIAPLVVNPDDDTGELAPTAALVASGPIPKLANWIDNGWRQQGIGGSNNWAISGAKNGSPAAVVTNDPHLDSRNLPGPWHPVGLITPELRAVGVATGLPGMIIGRNEHVAFGVTNAYADAVDLYIETVDPENSDNYLEGDVSIPFETRSEVIRIKDDAAEGGIRELEMTVRSTRRGPVVSEPGSEGTVLAMRWAAAEYMSPDLGLDALISATTIEEALSAVESAQIVSLNFVVGDVTGRIARRASGAAPIRLSGDGMSPFPITDGSDNWGGKIPGTEMPGEIDPEQGWTGTANHMTAPADYPYVYTTYASPDFRYRRIGELLSAEQLSAEQVWDAQYDTLNLYARDLGPIFAEALSQSEDSELQEVGAILAEWDFRDETSELAPTLFQEVARQLAQATFEDELGAEAAATYLSNWYVWQQRFHAMVTDGSSTWFDDTRTEQVEDLTALIQRSARAGLDRLGSTYGSDREAWLWGNVHQIAFQGPLRQSGWAGWLNGNRSIEMPGSGETLMRALYPYDEPYGSKWFASLRMTADLNDPDKVRAVLPGGVVGRSFTKHLDDQTDLWADKEAEVYWWFSDSAISDNAVDTLTLTGTGE
jgi:penicillin amidase